MGAASPVWVIYLPAIRPHGGVEWADDITQSLGREAGGGEAGVQVATQR